MNQNESKIDDHFLESIDKNLEFDVMQKSHEYSGFNFPDMVSPVPKHHLREKTNTFAEQIREINKDYNNERHSPLILL